MKLRRAAHTAWRAIADETVLIDLDKRQIYGLNETAAFVWVTLEIEGDAGALLRRLSGDRAPAFDERDVETFVDELIDLGLAERGEPTAGGGPAGAPTADAGGALTTLEAPRILWREKVEPIAGSCAFLPGQSALCNQVPMS